MLLLLFYVCFFANKRVHIALVWLNVIVQASVLVVCDELTRGYGLQICLAEMESASNDGAPVDLKLADIMNCPVCSRVLSDAKLLPCSHSCCMKCLESLTTEQQDVGEHGR